MNLSTLASVFPNKSALLLGGLGVTALATYLWATWEPAIPAPARARAPGAPSVNSVPGGPQTPEYDRLQQLADQRRAERAMATGGSAMPTPSRLEPLATQTPPAPSPPPPPPPQTEAANPVSSNGIEDPSQQTNEFARAMREQMQALLAYRERFSPKPTRMVVHEDVQGQRAREARRQLAEQELVEARAARPRDARGTLQPGDLLYAVLQTAINSDEPGPVRAKVVGERFKGSILLGGLKAFPPVSGNRPERVLVQFNYLTTPDRSTYPLEAFAVDTETARTALATGVDHHTLERWGSLIAASFLEGYGNAVRNSNRVTTVGLLGNVVSVPKDQIKHGDIAREAVGTVGERLGAVVSENFQRPNTITVASGTGIGVLIVAPAEPEADARQTASALELPAAAVERASLAPPSQPRDPSTPPPLPVAPAPRFPAP